VRPLIAGLVAAQSSVRFRFPRLQANSKFFICTSAGSILLLNQMVKYSSRMLNRTFAALADPTRRNILAHLARGDKCVTHLAKPHAMSLQRSRNTCAYWRRPGCSGVGAMDAFTKCASMQAAPAGCAVGRGVSQVLAGVPDRLAEYLEKENRSPEKWKTK